MLLTIPSLLSHIFNQKNFIFFSILKQFNNNIFIFINFSFLLTLILILKFNTFCNPTIFLELSSFDNVFNSNTLIYIFLTLFTKLKIFLTFKESNYTIKTISKYFFNASWSEREIGEMHGISFENKFDSRHILLDYSFTGFPMKKNYSLSGYVELVYNFIKTYIEYIKTILLESIKIDNFFDF